MFKQFFLIKIPKNINIYIDLKKKHLLILHSNNNKCLIKINLKFVKIKKKLNKTIFLYVVCFFLNSENLLFKIQQKKTVLFLKKLLKEIVFKNYKKLKLNGIGFKILIVQNIIHLKLGYSHSIYFKLPDTVGAKITKNNILVLFSFSVKKLTLISSLIKKCKKPDPYKGKGFLYENEKINLKIGKKN